MLDAEAKQIDALMSCKVPLRAVARVVRCSPQTLYDWLRVRRPGDATPASSKAQGAAPAAPPAATAKRARKAKA
jgi:transposase-like protein